MFYYHDFKLRPKEIIMDTSSPRYSTGVVFSWRIWFTP